MPLLAKWNNFSVISKGMPVAIIADKNYFTRCKTDQKKKKKMQLFSYRSDYGIQLGIDFK